MKLIALISLSSLAAISPAGAVTFFVNSGGSIQSALNQARDEDIIEVAAGTYNEQINFGRKVLTLRSVSGPENTIINGGAAGTTVEIRDGSEISGFTITGGRAAFGAGMNVSGNGTKITGNIFTGNVQEMGGFGAAIAGNNASPIISGNIFTNNSSGLELLSGTVAFVNGSSPLIQNNLFYSNQGRGISLTLPAEAYPVVTNNTFWANTSAIRLDARATGSGIFIQNNILGANEIGLEVELYEGMVFSWRNNLLSGNTTNYQGIPSLTGIDGNLEGEAAFADSVNGDFNLLAGSSAIDAGTNLLAPVLDFAGYGRPVDGDFDGQALTDIGAFEFIPEPTSAALLALGFLSITHSKRRPRGA